MAIDLDAIKRKLSQLQTVGTRQNTLWKPEPGKQTIRIVPYQYDKENPFQELYFHYDLGKKNFLSPVTYGKADPVVEFAEKFNNTLDFVDTIIAHNLNFDINVLRAELYRYNLLDIIIKLDSKKMICTMQYTKYIVCSKFKSGTGIKDPSLKELYQYFVKKEITNQHNSKYDTFNLWTIVKIMYDKNLIKI